MARRGRPKAPGYKFKNFDKTYRTYVKKYYAAARKKYNLSKGKRSNAKIPRTVTKQDLQNEMDDNLLTKADFRADYKSYKKDIIEEGSFADPTDRIVSHQAYEFSFKQFRGFRQSLRSNEMRKVFEDDNFKKLARERGIDIPDLEKMKKVSQYQFRSGKYKDSKEFVDAMDLYYWYMKDQAEKMGKDKREQWLYAKNEVSKRFFGRDDESGYYGDSE